jgi:hypothetical protein
MDGKIIPMPTCGKVLYNYTRCGEFYVIGCTIIETEYQNIKLDQNIVRNAWIYMMKRHPLLRSHLEINGSSISYNINNNIDANEIAWEKLNSRCELNFKLEEFNRKRFDYEAKCKLWR